MIKIILEYLPFLALGIVGHSLLGIYNNVFQLKEHFSLKKLLEGLWKAFVIASAFIITSLLYDKLFGVIELGSIELAPDLLMLSVCLMYLTKMLIKLKDIFQLDIVADKVDLIEVIETKEEDINEEQEEGWYYGSFKKRQEKPY